MLNTGKLAGKTLYISGASRGIGLEMAKKAARDGGTDQRATRGHSTVIPCPRHLSTISHTRGYWSL